MNLTPIFNALVRTLATRFQLTEGQHVYTVAEIEPIPSQTQFEIQVADGGSDYLDEHGSVRRQQFLANVGIILRRRVDWSTQDKRVLSKESESIQNYAREIVILLDRNYLEEEDGTERLVRPLVPLRETAPTKLKQDPGALVKIITFAGGVNDSLLPE